jgi:hypothetical protein
MAMNGAYICDIKSEQTIEGKKTFTKKIVAPAFVLEDGTELQNTAVTQINNNAARRLLLASGTTTIEACPNITFIEESLVIDGSLRATQIAGKLIGDGSSIHGLTFDNIDGNLPLGKLKTGHGLRVEKKGLTLQLGDRSGLSLKRDGLRVDASTIERSNIAYDNDMVVVHQPNTPSGIAKIPLKSLFSLIPSHNGSLFDFVNNGTNIGAGAHIYKNVSSSPRMVSLNFRTLTPGPNLNVTELENELVINLNDEVEVREVNISQSLILPQLSINDIENPSNGMLIYNEPEGRFYGYARNRWVALSPWLHDRA